MGILKRKKKTFSLKENKDELKITYPNPNHNYSKATKAERL